MLALATVAELTGQLAACAAVFQIWCIPFLIYLEVVDTTKASKWLTWGMISLLLAAPLGAFLPNSRPPTVPTCPTFH